VSSRGQCLLLSSDNLSHAIGVTPASAVSAVGGNAEPAEAADAKSRLSASRVGTATATEAIVRQDVRRMEPREAAGRCCCLTPQAATANSSSRAVPLQRCFRRTGIIV
jgi:hypothetical protein